MYISHLPDLRNSPRTLTPRAESPPTTIQSKGFWQVQFNFWGTILAFIAAIGIITGLLTWCLVCRGKRIEKRLARAKEREKEERQRNVERAVEGTESAARAWGSDADGDRSRNVGTGVEVGVRRSGIWGVGRMSVFGSETARAGVRKSVIGRMSVFGSDNPRIRLESRDGGENGNASVYERDGYGFNRNWGMEKEMGIEIEMAPQTPVPSYHSRDEEKMEVDRERERESGMKEEGGTGNVNKEGKKDELHKIEVNGTVNIGK